MRIFVGANLVFAQGVSASTVGEHKVRPYGFIAEREIFAGANKRQK
jgi:hypothetical protein